VRVVTLLDGKITRIVASGYGDGPEVSPPATSSLPRATCEPSTISVGDGHLDLIERCGPPAVRNVRKETRTLIRATGGGQESVSSSHVFELWSYDFGPESLVRLVELRDGVVKRVAKHGYGYSQLPIKERY